MGAIQFLKKIYHALRGPLEVRKRIRGTGNTVKLNGCIRRRVRIDIEGDDNLVQVDSSVVIEGLNLRIRGDRHKVSIGPRSWINNSRLHFEDQDCRITIGEGCLLNGPTLSAVENGCKIEIGSQSMVGEGADLRTSDSHSIIDTATNTRINPPGDLVLGERVWLGKEAVVLKGVTIGSGSIVGLRSVVTRDIPADSLAAGSPARVIRAGVTWDFEKRPWPEQPARTGANSEVEK